MHPSPRFSTKPWIVEMMILNKEIEGGRERERRWWAVNIFPNEKTCVCVCVCGSLLLLFSVLPAHFEKYFKFHVVAALDFVIL